MVEGRVEGGGGVRGGGGTYEVHASPPRLKEVQDALGMGYKDTREVNAGGGGRQSETDSVACKAGAKTTTAAQQRCSGMHTPLAPEYRVLPLPAPPPLPPTATQIKVGGVMRAAVGGHGEGVKGPWTGDRACRLH